MEVVILRKGKNAWIWVVKQGNNCPVLEFFKEELEGDEQNKAYALVKHICEKADIHNEQKFRQVEDLEGVYELKPTGTVRILCFWGEGEPFKSLVLAFGVKGKKAQGKLLRSDKKRAKQIREEYLRQREGEEK